MATGGMRTVKDAQTVLLTIDNEIQNTNATFTAFLIRFILIIFFLILFQTFCEKYLGLLFIVRVHLTVTFSAGSHSLNFSGQPLYFTNTNFLPFNIFFPNTFSTLYVVSSVSSYGLSSSS